MTKQETYIQFIVDELQKGNVVYKDVYLVFLSKFKCTEPTFVKYWKLANESYKDAQISINSQKAKEYTQNELERQKTALIDRNKFGEMLDNVFKLSYNEVVKTKGTDKNAVQSFIQVADRKAKFEGYDAPTKQETTLKGVDEIVIKKD